MSLLANGDRLCSEGKAALNACREQIIANCGKETLTKVRFFIIEMEQGHCEVTASIPVMKVLFRADGGQERGLGHVMRCLALADACAATGAEVQFAASHLPQQVRMQITARGYGVIALVGEGQQDAATLAQVEADWLIIDSYDIDAQHRRALARTVSKLAIIDDVYDNGPYDAELLINPNPGAAIERYGVLPAGQRQALGAQYIVLRQDIMAARRARTYDQAAKVFISCGGSDPSGAAKTCLDMLSGFSRHRLDITVLIGPAAQAATLTSTLQSGQHTVRALTSPQPIEQLLNAADFAILAAGTTQWEAAYLGCPFMALIVADNQEPGAQFFAQQGASITLDWRAQRLKNDFLSSLERLTGSAKMRAQQARKARRLIDGEGAARLAALLD